MSSAVQTILRARGRVALIKITKPPVNSLGFAVRKGIADGLDAAEKDGASAVVFAGDGATFPAGADITEFAAGGGFKEPTLTDIIERVSALKLHTVAAIHGTALGGGLELALGCHWRLADAKAKCGLPEVHLGILPGAGGTQRLPRIVGCEEAIKLMTSGRPVGAAAAAKLGLVDEVVGDPKTAKAADAAALVERALDFAAALEGAPVDFDARVVARRAVAPVPDGFFSAAKAMVVKASRGEVAGASIVDAVEAATTAPSFEAGLDEERRLFLELAAGGQARALQHVFFAERAMGKVEGLDKAVKPLPLKSAAIVGAGTMGGGIAMCFAERGVPVTIIDTSAEALERGLKTIRGNWQRQVDKGKLSAAALEERVGRIRTTTTYDDAGVAAADIAVEAVFERMSIKQTVLKQLDGACKAGAILATNTSTLNIDEIAAATSRPDAVVGTHFFSPANVMPLLENVRGAASSPTTLATAMAMGKLLGKKAVLAGNCFGFIGNRMLEGYVREALFMLELGALPADVDGPMRAFGMPMGPLQMSDLAGNDIGYNVRKDFGWTFPASALADKLVESGRLGQKTGGGWYDYDAKRKPNPSAAVETMIVEHSAAAGATRRPMGADEVLDRCLLPLVNEVRADRSPPSPHRARRLPQSRRPAPLCPAGLQDSGGGHRAARVGHRRRLPLRLRLPALARRADALGAPRPRRRPPEARRRPPPLRGSVSARGALEAVGAPRPRGGRRVEAVDGATTLFFCA